MSIVVKCVLYLLLQNRCCACVVRLKAWVVVVLVVISETFIAVYYCHHEHSGSVKIFTVNSSVPQYLLLSIAGGVGKYSTSFRHQHPDSQSQSHLTSVSYHHHHPDHGPATAFRHLFAIQQHHNQSSYYRHHHPPSLSLVHVISISHHPRLSATSVSHHHHQCHHHPLPLPS